MTEEGYRGQGQPAVCPLAQYHSFPQYYLILAQSSICLRISKSVCEDLPCFLHTGLCPSWWNVWWRPKVNLSSMILLSIGSCKPAREGWSRNTASRSRETPRGQKRRSSHQLCYLHFFSQPSLGFVLLSLQHGVAQGTLASCQVTSAKSCKRCQDKSTIADYALSALCAYAFPISAQCTVQSALCTVRTTWSITALGLISDAVHGRGRGCKRLLHLIAA